MSLSITQQTNSIALAKGLTPLGFASNNYIAVAGTAETGHIQLTANPVDGDTLNIGWVETQLTFTFKTTPNDSGLQLPLNSSANLETYALNQLLPALKQNRILYAYFNLAHNSSGPNTTAQIDITAQNHGSISLIITTTVAGSPGETPGTAQVLQENFSVVVDIYKEQTFPNLNFVFHASLELKVNEVGQTMANLGPYLKSLFNAMPLPSQSMSTITRAMYLAQRVHIRYAEKYGETPLVKQYTEYSKATEAAPLLVLNGGYRSNEHPDQTFVADFYTNTIARKFLTKNPLRELSVYDDTVAFLGYINNAGSTLLELQISLFYTDGSSLDHPVIELDISAYNGLGQDVYLIPCGINMLSLNTDSPTKTINYYQVQITDNQSHLSESFVFVRDGKYHLQRNQFLFQNSLGMPETIYCTGDFSKGANFTRQTYRQPLSETYAATHTENATFNHRFVDVFSVNTGHGNKQYIQYLERELLMSQHVYRIINGTYRKVLINKSSINLLSEDEGNRSLDFEFTETFQNESA